MKSMIYLAGAMLIFCGFANLGAEEIFVRANQVGYSRADRKLGLVFSKELLPDSFELIEAISGKTVFTGVALPVRDSSWGVFSNHATLNFSSWTKPGRYRLRVGSALCAPFVLGDQVYGPLSGSLLEFMRQQRCGYNPWLDAICHPFDGRSAYGPQTNGTYVDARGGWHDAADLLKYLITSANATAQMLLAYEIADPHQRQGFPDRVNALGQPAPNGIPDLLDEARWGLDWMLKLHPAPDQLYHQVADDRDHVGRRLPQDENVDYGWGKGGSRVVYFADGQPQGLLQYKSQSTGMANLAGRYAAAMALAFQIWQHSPQNKAFAEKCLQAGREVYVLGRAHEGSQQGNSYKAPYRYEETTWADDMEWGAAELFRATRERHFLREAEHYAWLAADESWMGKEQTGHYQFYPFMNAGHFRLYDLAPPKIKAELAAYYRAGIEKCRLAGAKNPYRAGVPFIWCSNNLITALATQCLFYELMTHDRHYRDFAAEQRDWLLGRNPWGFSMFTGVGAAFPHNPHLMTMELAHRPVSGGLVDGPVYERIFKSLKGVSISEPDPLAQFQGPAVYHDDIQDYSSNEPTMDGTASAILLFSVWQNCVGL